MHSVLETITGIMVFALIAGPFVGFAWVMRAIKQKEQAELIKYGLISEEKRA